MKIGKLVSLPGASAVLLALACAAESHRGPDCGDPGEAPCHVSVISLIAHSVAYDDLIVQVMGVTSLEFEGTGVYLTHDDFRYGVTANGLWLDVMPGTDSAAVDPCHGMVVIVEGLFDADHHGHLGAWSGAITQVTRVDPVPPRHRPTGVIVERADLIPDTIPAPPRCGISL